jgi:hypothetical protein
MSDDIRRLKGDTNTRQEEFKDEFRRLIQLMESSGGRNMNHRVMKSGLHKGTKAIGHSGLMPKTIQEFSKRRIRDGQGDEFDKQIMSVNVDKDPMAIERMLSERPEMYQKYKDTIMEHVLDKQNYDPVNAAVSWHEGHNITPEKAMLRSKKMPEYVGRVKGFMEDENMFQPKLEDSERMLAEEPKSIESGPITETPESRERFLKTMRMLKNVRNN